MHILRRQLPEWVISTVKVRPDHARSGAALVSETGLMAPTTAPKKWLNASPGLLRAERPDYAYLKKVFQHTRILLSVKPTFRRSMKRR